MYTIMGTDERVCEDGREQVWIRDAMEAGGSNCIPKAVKVFLAARIRVADSSQKAQNALK